MSVPLTDPNVLYSPSFWSKRLPETMFLEEHLRKATQFSQETQKDIPCQLNLKYGPEKENAYDLLGTDLDGSAPIFIFIHGGYWQVPSIVKELYWFVAKQLYKNGIKTILIEHELCPKVSFSTVAENMQAAIKECLKYAESTKTTGIHLAGYSSGAYLAVQLFESFIPNLPGETRKLFKSVFMFCGIYDLVPLIQTKVNDALKLDEESAVAASPIRQTITGGETVFYSISAQYDGPPFLEQAKAMEEHLLKCGARAEYVYMENTDHFDIVENLYDEEFKLTKFIIEKVNESV